MPNNDIIQDEPRKRGRPKGSTKEAMALRRAGKKVKTKGNDRETELIKTAAQFVSKGAEPGENSAVTAFLLQVMMISSKADRNNIETLYACLREYMEYCMEHDIRITNTGCYTACKLGRDDIDNWASGKARKSDPRYREFANYVRMICTMSREQLIIDGKLNPIIGIWWQKVYDRYTDQVPVTDSEKTSNVDEAMSAEDIAKKYEDLATD